MDSAYIKALKEKYKNSLAKAKEREKIKLGSLYRDLALAVVQKTQSDSEFKRACSDDELIAKALLPLLETYLPTLSPATPAQDSKETPKEKE